MPVSPARSPVRAVKIRTSERADLDNKIGRLQQARAGADEAQRPLDRARDQGEHAAVMVRNAEAGVSGINDQEAALIKAWDAAGSPWPPPSPPPELKKARAEADDALAVARRLSTTVQRNAELAQGPAQQAANVVNERASEVELAVRDVMMAEGQAALSRLTDARANAAEAEGAVSSIAAAMVARKWFLPAEHLHIALHTLLWPAPTINPAPFTNLIERLASDADAVVEI